MHRELYALLCADGGKNFQELAPILPTDAPGGYKKKIKLGARKVRQWKWEPFSHPVRKDGPFLCHWRRMGEEVKEYPFAKFNAVIFSLLFGKQFLQFNAKLIYFQEAAVPQYNETEYVNHLEHDNWTKSETDHLFDLCKRFDMRFVLVQVIFLKI
jgi:DNA methyltransferase 1-associated protein 1